jgi:hypothetical protein
MSCSWLTAVRFHGLQLLFTCAGVDVLLRPNKRLKLAARVD